MFNFKIMKEKDIIAMNVVIEKKLDNKHGI